MSNKRATADKQLESFQVRCPKRATLACKICGYLESIVNPVESGRLRRERANFILVSWIVYSRYKEKDIVYHHLSPVKE
eukprot:4312674-Pyramimonas_sp.AAC.1